MRDTPISRGSVGFGKGRERWLDTVIDPVDQVRRRCVMPAGLQEEDTYAKSMLRRLRRPSHGDPPKACTALENVESAVCRHKSAGDVVPIRSPVHARRGIRHLREQRGASVFSSGHRRVHTRPSLTFGARNAGPGHGAGGGEVHRVVFARGAAPVQCVPAAISDGIAFFRQHRSGSLGPPSGVQSAKRARDTTLTFVIGKVRCIDSHVQVQQFGSLRQ